MQSRIVLIALAIIVVLISIHTCTKKNYVAAYEENPVLQYKYEIIQDTLTTIVTKTVIKTDTSGIEERINLAMAVAESTVREAVMERDSVALKIVELEEIENVTIYDTISVKIDVPPDSVMIYNVFEYHSIDGDEVIAMRDTIQSRKVSRYYAQKYITQ
mgnify:CR=1 FL=1